MAYQSAGVVSSGLKLSLQANTVPRYFAICDILLANSYGFAYLRAMVVCSPIGNVVITGAPVVAAFNQFNCIIIIIIIVQWYIQSAYSKQSMA